MLTKIEWIGNISIRSDFFIKKSSPFSGHFQFDFMSVYFLGIPIQKLGKYPPEKFNIFRVTLLSVSQQKRRSMKEQRRRKWRWWRKLKFERIAWYNLSKYYFIFYPFNINIIITLQIIIRTLYQRFSILLLNMGNKQCGDFCTHADKN